MTQMRKLTAEDGHTLDAAVAGDSETARGGVVVLQEIFGLNDHIRDLPRRFAEAGYYAVAPALFDRAERGVELAYDAVGRDRGLALRAAVDDDAIFDVSAAITAAAAAGPVVVVGFCWAARLPGAPRQAWLALPARPHIMGVNCHLKPGWYRTARCWRISAPVTKRSRLTASTPSSTPRPMPTPQW